jgi:hypothetical protein
VRFSDGEMGVGGGHYVESTGCLNKHPDLTRCGCGFGRVVIGIRAGGINEGADGVANFCPAKTWALGSTWS